MGYFCFSQEDRDGRRFRFDRTLGLTRIVFIQALTAADAKVKALTLGISSRPCDCCETSWYFQGRENDVCSFEPRISGRSIEQWMNSYYFSRMMSPTRPEVFVHLMSGEIVGLVYGSRYTLTLHKVERVEEPF